MMVYSVYDSEFSEYGFIAEGYPLHGLRAALGILKLPDENGYVPREETLHAAPDAETCGDRIFADMPYQWGYCGGVPAKVDVMRFHSGPRYRRLPAASCKAPGDRERCDRCCQG